MSWFRSEAGENDLVVKSYVECCFADFYYDSKVTVTKNIEQA